MENKYRTIETMQYYNNIVESIKQKLNVNIPIIIADHDKLPNKKAREALGIAHIKYWRHGKKHKELTKQLLNTISA